MLINNHDTAQYSRKYFLPPQFGGNAKYSQATMGNQSHRPTDNDPPNNIVPCTHPSINTPQRTCEDNISGKPPLEQQLNRANLSTNTDSNQTANQRDSLGFRMLTLVPFATTVVPWFLLQLVTLVQAVISSKHERNTPSLFTGRHRNQIAKTSSHASSHRDLDLSVVYDCFEARSSLTPYGMQSSERLSRSLVPLTREPFDAQEHFTIRLPPNTYAMQSSSLLSRSFWSLMQPTRDRSTNTHDRQASNRRVRLTNLSKLSFTASILRFLQLLGTIIMLRATITIDPTKVAATKRPTGATPPRCGGIFKQINSDGKTTLVPFTGGIALNEEGEMQLTKFISWSTDPFDDTFVDAAAEETKDDEEAKAEPSTKTTGRYVLLHPLLHTNAIAYFDSDDEEELDALRAEPLSPFMRRLQDSKSVSKTKERCIAYTGTRLYNGIKDSKVNWKLREFKLAVWKHLFVNGMGDLFAMTHHGKVFNLVFHYHRLPKNAITTYIDAIKKCSDIYDNENLSNIAGYLFNVLDPTFENEVRRHGLIASRNPNGLELWSAIMETTFKNSYRSIRAWKDKIRHNNILSIPGQNVEIYFENVMEELDHLDGAGNLGGEDLMNLLTNLEDVEEERFRLQVIPVIAAVKDLQQQEMALGSTSVSSAIKWPDIVQALVDEYRTLLADNRWRPAVKSVKDGPDFGIKAAAALQQSQLADRTPRGTQHRLTTGTGTPTPPSDRPTPPTPPSDTATPKQKYTPEEYFALLTTPPAPGAPTTNITVEGLRRPRSWCPICWRNFYHGADQHDAYIARNPERWATIQAENAAKGLPPPSGAAALRVASYDNWDDDDEDFINICRPTRS